MSTTPYDRLEVAIADVHNIGHAIGILHWDQQVTMPDGGTPARAQQRATLHSVLHEKTTDDEIGSLLAEIDPDSLTGDQRAVVREVRRQYERQTAVPADLQRAIAETSTEAHPIWMEAKETDDFALLAPSIESLVERKREYAAHVDPDAPPYEVLCQEYAPDLDLKTIDRTLTELRDALVPLLAKIRESGVDVSEDASTAHAAFAGPFDVDDQHELSVELLERLDADFERSRLDRAPHPFVTGNQFDLRITTRFDQHDVLDGLSSTVHEFGHATYGLGLPQDRYATPLGEPRDTVVHESQSRLWENHIARSAPFWEWFLPIAAERFPALADATPAAAYHVANRVHEDNPIRVMADELSYHLHIIVRYEIERDLIEGRLAVEEIPHAWNGKYEEYLGIRPESDTEGCLQDIHWSAGQFGYFPTYSLGSALAAQLYAAMETDIGSLDERIRSGAFNDVHEWLGEHVHRHGQRYPTPELVERATGEEIVIEPFVEYVEEKFGELYALG